MTKIHIEYAGDSDANSTVRNDDGMPSTDVSTVSKKAITDSPDAKGTRILSATRCWLDGFDMLRYDGITVAPGVASREDAASGIAYAATADANLRAYGFALTADALAAIATIHANTPRTGVDVNPVADVAAISPDGSAKPMYPDFPTQVMDIDEAEFRFHQATHYASTYGVEAVSWLLGEPVEVLRGWRPDMPEAEKHDKGNPYGGSLRLLDVALDDGVLSAYPARGIRRVIADRINVASRMTDAQIDCLVDALMSDGHIPADACAFRENAIMAVCRLLGIMADTRDGNVRDHAARRAEYCVAKFYEDASDVARTAFAYVWGAARLQDLNAEQRGGIDSPSTDRAWLPRNPFGVTGGKADGSKAKRHRARRLTTAQKRLLCHFLGIFLEYKGEGHVRQDLADMPRAYRRALAYLSPSRFCDGKVLDIVRDALSDDPSTKSWGSRVETGWLAVREAMGTPDVRDAMSGLVGTLSERPGQLLRSLASLHDLCFQETEFDPEVGYQMGRDVTDAVIRVSGWLSPVTLARLAADMSADKVDATEGGARMGRQETEEAKRLRERQQTHRYVAECDVVPALRARMTSMDTPLRGKSVYVDWGDVSPEGSVVYPNADGSLSGMPPVGTAYRLSDDGTVRLFCFWNDGTQRVDVDLHATGVMCDGSPLHVGWNAGFRSNGITFSGDIIDSHDAAEYVDIDMAKARAGKVERLWMRLDVFTQQEWKDVAECFCGCMSVGDTAPDAALYRGGDCLFRDDLTKANGRSMLYAVVDVQEGWVRIVRGGDVRFAKTDFTAGRFVELLVDAQGGSQAETRETADIVIVPGRVSGEDEREVSLVDAGWFLGGK